MQPTWFGPGRSWPTPGLFGPLHQNNHRPLTRLWRTWTVWNHFSFKTATCNENLGHSHCHGRVLIIVWIMRLVEMFLAGHKKDFPSTGEYTSVLCAAVVVSVQERVGWREGTGRRSSGDRRAFISLNLYLYVQTTARHVVLIFTAS